MNPLSRVVGGHLSKEPPRRDPERAFGKCETVLHPCAAQVMLLMTARELELALCGTPTLDLDDWKAHTVYKGDFADLGCQHPVVAWFWKCVAKFPPEKRAALLLWCTGHSRVPVQGFSHLQGRDGVLRPFTLTSVSIDHACFPRAHTCFNRIDVPLYKSQDDLVRAFNLVLDLGDATFSMD